MRSVLIQQVYPDTEYVQMLELTQAHHKAYCEKHNIEYLAVFDEVFPHDIKLGGYGKIKLIQQAKENGYDSIIFLDTDAFIRDLDANVCAAIEHNKIGACWHRIPQLHHWNVGALYIDNCAETKEFIDKWLSVYPPPRDGWNEQGVFNRMAMEGKTVVTLSDKWNATFDVSMVPDAVVLGFHGQGDPQRRVKIMTEAFYTLFPEQKVQGVAEVTNDG